MKTQKNPLLPVITILLLALICLLATGRLMDVVEEVTFYWFDHTETELKVKAYAEEHHVFYSEYPDSLVELLERNPETEEFVLRYPFREDIPYDLSEYADSEIVPLFMQWDQRWGYETYGSDVIGNGCPLPEVLLFRAFAGGSGSCHRHL